MSNLSANFIENFSVYEAAKKYPAAERGTLWLGIAVQAVALGVSGADLFGALVRVVVALLSIARAANRIFALEGYSVTLGSVLPGSTAY